MAGITRKVKQEQSCRCAATIHTAALCGDEWKHGGFKLCLTIQRLFYLFLRDVGGELLSCCSVKSIWSCWLLGWEALCYSWSVHLVFSPLVFVLLCIWLEKQRRTKYSEIKTKSALKGDQNKVLIFPLLQEYRGALYVKGMLNNSNRASAGRCAETPTLSLKKPHWFRTYTLLLLFKSCIQVDVSLQALQIPFVREAETQWGGRTQLCLHCWGTAEA